MADLAESAQQSVIEQYPCRDLQVQQLTSLLQHDLPSPPAIVVHGLEATGKSSLVRAVLSATRVDHAVVRSRECITGRHLFERTVAACVDSLASEGHRDEHSWTDIRCENVGALAVHLSTLLKGRSKFALVFDGIDEQREAPATLLSALARFSESIPNLVPIFIVTTPGQRFLHRMGVPHVHFPAYTRSEAVEIIARRPPSMEDSRQFLKSDEELNTLWARFALSVYDSLARGAAHDVVAFRELCIKLWPTFIKPIQDGTLKSTDFAKLMIARRTIFQTEDMLIDSVLEADGTLDSSGQDPENMISPAEKTSELPYYAKYLLCAAYLASYNPARQDSLLFMRSADTRKRRRGGGGVRKATSNLASASHAGRQAKNRKIPRRLLGPGSFPMERLLAIFHAILPHTLAPTADLGTQVATLAALRLLVRSGVGATSDVLDASAKWRVDIGSDFAVALARSVGFELSDYILE